jgi:hypothetical protein
MAGLTLAHAEAQLALYLSAEAAVLSRQSYTIAGRSMTLADLKSIQAGIMLWDARCRSLDVIGLGRGRARTIVPSR